MNTNPTWFFDSCNKSFSNRYLETKTLILNWFITSTIQSSSAIYFSGSFARGVPTEDSDVDLAVFRLDVDENDCNNIINGEFNRKINIKTYSSNNLSFFRLQSLGFLTSLPFHQYIAGNSQVYAIFKNQALQQIKAAPLVFLENLRSDIHRPLEALLPTHHLFNDIKVGYGGIIEYQYIALLNYIFHYSDLNYIHKECYTSYLFLVFYREYLKKSYNINKDELSNYFSSASLQHHCNIIAYSYRKAFEWLWAKFSQ